MGVTVMASLIRLLCSRMTVLHSGMLVQNGLIRRYTPYCAWAVAAKRIETATRTPAYRAIKCRGSGWNGTEFSTNTRKHRWPKPRDRWH